MPVKVQADLPVKEILESENIFVMDETRAVHQDIRPLKIMILNLMPLKEDTELQLLRSLSNTSLQVDVTFLMVASHEAKNTSTSHLNTFYVKFEDVRKNYYDGMIITGAPVEQMEFEEVDYWDELTKIMDWTNTHVTSTMFPPHRSTDRRYPCLQRCHDSRRVRRSRILSWHGGRGKKDFCDGSSGVRPYDARRRVPPR